MDRNTVVNATDISERRRQQEEEDKSANETVPVKTLLKTSEEEESRVLEDHEESREQRFTTDDDEDPSSSKRRCLGVDASFSAQQEEDKSANEEWRFLDEMVKQSMSKEDDDDETVNVKQSKSEEDDAVLAEDLSSKLSRLGLDAQDYKAARTLFQLSRDTYNTTQTQNQETHAPTTQTQLQPNLDSKPFKCNVCDKRFTSHQALGGHMARNKHHGDTRKPRSIENVIAEKRLKSNHECPICHRAFPNGHALGGHKVHHHKKRKHDEVNTDGSQELNKTPSPPPQEDFDDDHGEEA